MVAKDIWRWIQQGPADGATHMSIDRALLENIHENELPIFRVYQWKPYCISLGYHQSTDHLNLDLCRKKGVDVVRRPTGGRAVYHSQELTYSVIVPKKSPLYYKGIHKVYSQISRGLVKGIQKSGIPAELEKRTLNLRSHYQTDISVNCFSAAARYEVMVQGRKLVGSAQRLHANGILQHGSILMGDAHLDLPQFVNDLEKEDVKRMQQELEEKTISIGQYLKKDIAFDDIAEFVKQGLEEQLDIRFQDDELTSEEQDHVSQFKSECSILSKLSEGMD